MKYQDKVHFVVNIKTGARVSQYCTRFVDADYKAITAEINVKVEEV